MTIQTHIRYIHTYIQYSNISNTPVSCDCFTPAAVWPPSPAAALQPLSASPEPCWAHHLWPAFPLPVGWPAAAASPETHTRHQCNTHIKPGSTFEHVCVCRNLGEESPPLPVPELQVSSAVPLDHSHGRQLLLPLSKRPAWQTNTIKHHNINIGNL